MCRAKVPLHRRGARRAGWFSPLAQPPRPLAGHKCPLASTPPQRGTCALPFPLARAGGVRYTFRMFALEIFLYVLAFAVLILDIGLVWLLAEKIVRSVRRQVPFLPSNERLRAAVVQEINAHYPHLRTACDIGSGFGGLARAIARDCDVSVLALENMPLLAFASKLADAAARGGRGESKTVWCDAFRYVAESDGFDLAVAYMGPAANKRLWEYRDKFRVLITLDFPIQDATATRTLDLGDGYTKYGDTLYPHRIYVYEI